MKGVENERSGKRVLLLAEVILKKGQQVKKVLRALEPAYIEAALEKGFEILNDKGTKRPVHTITSKGRKKSHKPFDRKMTIKA